MSPNAQNSTSVDNIRKGNYKVPMDKYLKNHSAPSIQPSTNPAGQPFIGIPEGVDTEVPF
jgi:hypothetical protein